MRDRTTACRLNDRAQAFVEAEGGPSATVEQWPDGSGTTIELLDNA
jgi:hypothetical protein